MIMAEFKKLISDFRSFRLLNSEIGNDQIRWL